MKIEFVGQEIERDLKKDIELAVKTALEHLKQGTKKIMLSIAFIDKDEMQELNKRTRNIDSVTDVLSFPNFNMTPFNIVDEKDKSNYINKYIFLGDMAICEEQARKQADEYEVTLKEEIIKLVIHSTLHLMGFDHIKDEDYEIMNQQEQEIASIFYTNKKI